MSNSIKWRIISLIGAGAAGALAALLFTSKSGKDLRKDLKRKADETEKIIDTSKGKDKESVNSGLTIFPSAKNKTDNVHSRGKKVVDSATKKPKTSGKSRTNTIKKTKK